jgi:Protein of unknown function (DUF1769)
LFGRRGNRTVSNSAPASSSGSSNNASSSSNPAPRGHSLTRSESTGSCCSSSLGVGTFEINGSKTKKGVADEDDDDDYTDDLDNLNDEIDDRIVLQYEESDSDHIGHHPALQTVCVMDCHQQARIIPNTTDTPYRLINDCFEGHVMLLMRTPDVDDPRDRTSLGTCPRKVSEYFAGKKRRFEFQFQIRLKKVPTGPLFLGCELEHSIRVGTLTKGLVGILLAMVRRINPGFHYSWGPLETMGANQRASGDYEKTHLSFPVEASMDRIVITKPGETAPVLGEELFETAESVKRRRKMGAGSVDWNLNDTYTMCLWSAYADWIKWKSINVPGVSPFSLSRVTGTQPIYLSVYEITSCTNADYRRKRPPHLRKDLNQYTRLEFSNSEKTVGGLAEQVLGRKAGLLVGSSDHSVPDTESVGSEFETMSRVSHITN